MTDQVDNIEEQQTFTKDDLDISDYILVNMIHKDRADSFVVPVDQVHKSDKLDYNKNFGLHISDYYTGNKGLEMMREGCSKEDYEEWADKNPGSAALISIIWQLENAQPFDPPEWWPYKSKDLHTFVLRPGLIYTTFMVKLIINIDFKLE